MILRLFLLVAFTAEVAVSQECEEGWTLYAPENMCIFAVDNRQTWTNARDTCYSLNADLAMSKTEDKNNALESIVAENGNVFWIGLKKLERRADFQWIDGTTLGEYINWAPGEPNPVDPLMEDCVEFRTNGYWNDEQCVALNRPLCERSIDVIPFPPTTCPSEWSVHNNEYCFLDGESRKTWQNARSYCRGLEADLIVIRNGDLNNFVQNHVADAGSTPYWIGLTDKMDRANFYWVDDDQNPIQVGRDYTNWLPGEPNNSDGLYEDCVEMIAESGGWNDEQCIAPQKYICGRPQVIPTTTPGPSTTPRATHPPATSPDCGDGWLKLDDTCVLVVGTQLSFELAQEYCQNRHANLIKFESQRINDMFVDQESIPDAVYWIGLRDRVEDNKFVWIDGSTPSYTNWAPGEPNNVGLVGEDCVEMRPNGQWNDDSCVTFNYFACSKGYEEIPKCDFTGGWETYDGSEKCYKWIGDRMRFNDANDYCGTLDGYLISINDEQEQNFATTLQLRYANLQYWIGLTDNENRGTFIWTDETNTDGYRNWGEGEPNSDIYPACGMVQSPNPDVWSVDECDERKRFICETDQGTCADGWIKHGGDCYQFNPLKRTWSDASYYCSSQGGWLGTIFNGAENSFIALNMLRLNDENVDAMWFGYSDYVRDGTWEWVHDSRSTYTNWPPGQPKNTYGQADCAYLDTGDISGTWNSMLCSQLAGFTCKIKAGSAVTPVTAPDKVGSCERGWALYGDSCYTIPSEQLSFSDAETHCAAMHTGAHLASILSDGEQSFITERLYFINGWVWIGLTDAEQENVWKWTDGSGYEYMNWAEGEPNNVNNEDCVHLGFFGDHQVGLWNDIGCGEEDRFICKMPKYNTPPVTETPPITLPPSGRCGAGWVYDSGSNNCFKYSMDRLYWSDANVQCHHEGGLLTSITNQAESDFHRMSVLYYKVTYNIWSFWIGLHDTNMEDGFQWVDGAPVSFLNWDAGEPNDAAIGEDYVELLNHNGKWNDLHQNTEIGYSCKRARFITDQFRVMTNQRLDVPIPIDTPIGNVWPETCALSCYGNALCKSFNYQRSTRTCSLLNQDQYGQYEFVPEFEDPYDYYERDYSGPPIIVPTTISPEYGCGTGETGYRSFCYTLVTSVASWSDMQGLCELRSANLVSIADNSEMNFVISLMQTGNTPTMTIDSTWIGLSDTVSESTYAWNDGSDVTYTNWAAGQPENAENHEDCVSHNIDMNGWIDNTCTGTQHYGVCKKPKTTSNVVAPPTEGCPTGWLKYMSSCYQLVKDQKTWIDARDDCLTKNGRLTIINNKFEQAFLASQMGALYTYSGDYWIGLSDTDNPGTYLWVDGSYPTLSAWGPSQPNEFLGQCVALISAIDGVGGSAAGLWFDENCYAPHNYICERPVDGTTDTPYTKAPVTNPSNVGCTEPNSIGYGSNCFVPFELDPNQQINWNAARAYCQNLEGDLASFKTGDEYNYVANTYVPIDPETAKYGFWIGLNDRDIENGWQWSDGTAVTFTNWHAGEPNNYGSGEDCTEMYFTFGGQTNRGWNDLSCSTTTTRSVLCKIPKRTQDPPTTPAVGICPSDPDWGYYPPYCYYFSDLAGNNDRKSWKEAEAYCNTMGGNLVSIESEAENQALMIMAPILANEYWIGLYQEVVAGNFKWSDGTPFTYENWNRGEPNYANGEEMCAEIYRYNGLRENGVWNDAACGISTPFICKRPEGNIDPITRAPTEPPTGGCSAGYFKYFNSCYRVGGYTDSDKYSWEDAREICQGEGGNLAGIHSQPVQSLLTSMLLDLTGDAWIGFWDKGSNGRYHWTDGEPAVYTNWFPGEPTGHISLPGAPARNCVEMLNEQWYAGMWSDSECSNPIAYVCEKSLDPAEPDTPPEDRYCDDASYLSYGDSCFKLDTTLRSYDDAQAFCQDDGGNLASIPDAHYEAFLEYMLYSRGVADAWIGMQNKDGQYQWVDDWPVYVTMWGDKEPSNNEGEGCVILKAEDRPSWDDTLCAETERHATLCRVTSAQPPPPVEQVQGFCPPDTDQFGAYCYYLPSGLVYVEWYTARYQCQQMGGDLASIHNKATNEYIRKLVETRLGIRNVWIGLERGASGGFNVWNDGTPVDFENWNNGEPTNDWRDNQENCIEIYTNEYGTWKDEVCSYGSSYICQIPIYDNSTIAEPVSGLSGGAIAGIVISCVLVVTVILLVVGYLMGMRSVPKLPKIPTPSSSSSSSKDPYPTTPSGFDNVVYTPDSKSIQMDKTGSVA